MQLRKLKYKDIPYMLEWMHDKDIVKYLSNNFLLETKESQKKFIDSSWTKHNKNFAIVDEKDNYLGSISLKNIDKNNRKAEYAICLRKSSCGKNISKQATIDLLKFAFYELELNRIYLNVLCKNERAIKFYEKMGFILEGQFKSELFIDGEFCDTKWFRMLKDEFEELYGKCKKN